MPRYFEPISKDHLRAKLVDQFGTDDGSDRYIDARKIVKGLAKDIKVEFDLENVLCDDGDELTGFRVLENGMAMLGIFAGGDWESGVFFACYYDGKRVRAYVPTDGNPYNTDTMRSFGNDDEADLKNARKRWTQFRERDSAQSDDFEREPQKIFADIQGRILRRPTS